MLDTLRKAEKAMKGWQTHRERQDLEGMLDVPKKKDTTRKGCQTYEERSDTLVTFADDDKSNKDVTYKEDGRQGQIEM